MMRITLAALLFLSSIPTWAVDVTVFAGYWSAPKSSEQLIKLKHPNLFLHSKGKEGKETVFFADAVPLIKESEVLAAKAVDLSRLPSGGGLLKLKLSKEGKESLERFFNAWTDNPDTNRNLLFVSGGEIKLVYEPLWVWLSIDELYVQAGARSEAINLEQVFNGER